MRDPRHERCARQDAAAVFAVVADEDHAELRAVRDHIRRGSCPPVDEGDCHDVLAFAQRRGGLALGEIYRNAPVARGEMQSVTVALATLLLTPRQRKDSRLRYEQRCAAGAERQAEHRRRVAERLTAAGRHDDAARVAEMAQHMVRCARGSHRAVKQIRRDSSVCTAQPRRRTSPRPRGAGRVRGSSRRSSSLSGDSGSDVPSETEPPLAVATTAVAR